MDFDKDLQSIQEVRWLVAKAVVAQKELAKMSQQQVDGSSVQEHCHEDGSYSQASR